MLTSGLVDSAHATTLSGLMDDIHAPKHCSDSPFSDADNWP